MKKLILVVCVIVGITQYSLAQIETIRAKSIVKIVTSSVVSENGEQVKKINTATAWCFKEPTLLVTSLHTVAGATKIEIIKNNAIYGSAKIVNVLLEADLALLRIDSGVVFNLTPLNLDTSKLNPALKFSAWGFSKSSYAVQKEEVRFAPLAKIAPTLGTLLSGDLKNELKLQTYPLANSKIYRLNSFIQTEFSGAPVLSSSGKVIGIANAGLRSGATRINWVMPAAEYVNRLINSKDVKPTKTSSQISNYNNSTTAPITNSDSENKIIIQAESTNTEIKSANANVFNTWTTNYGMLYKNVSQNSKVDLDKYLTNYKFPELKTSKYIVYENYVTGATFTTPDGVGLTSNENNFICRNKTRTIELFNRIDKFKNYTEANVNLKKLATDFANGNVSEGVWEVVKDSEKNTPNAELQTTSYRVTLTKMNTEIAFNIQIDGTNLLLTSVIYNKNLKTTDVNYQKELAQYGLAMLFSDFVKN